ncbi:MAG: class A beta-lactamase-related serine hydrolase [Bryobacterales bacterium]|nr:class A beta-lactamase-related serine hydrolase [Bryobacterales bacterium]
MPALTRRDFSTLAVVAGAAAGRLSAAGIRNTASIDDTLRGGIERRKIPAVTAMVATSDAILYQGAFGKRDASPGVPVKLDSIFAIASMTKAVTSTAALQLVDQGKVKLDEPASRHLPELKSLQVFEGVDSAGKPILRPARKPVTLRHLLTHTSGFCYDTWSQEMQDWIKAGGAPPMGVAPNVPLIFEPGTRWQYGYGLDWSGKLVENVSGLTLEQYFQKNICEPLGMKDTSFVPKPENLERTVSRYDYRPDGSFKEQPRDFPPVAYNGGGGLNSTVGDYIKFTQMILRNGRGADGKQILRPGTVKQMSSNQIGNLGAGKLKTMNPGRSSEVNIHPGAIDKWGLGFLINTTAYQGGRAAGSLAWAGIWNTFYWIDPKSGISAVIMMQFLPFVHTEAVGMLGDFEKAVYAQMSS